MDVISMMKLHFYITKNDLNSWILFDDAQSIVLKGHHIIKERQGYEIYLSSLYPIHVCHMYRDRLH